MMKNRIGLFYYIILTALIITSLLVVFGCSHEETEPTDKKEDAIIELDAVGAWMVTSVENIGLELFLKNIEEDLSDRIKINYLGGPEVFPTNEQVDLLGRGAFDILGSAVAYTNLPELQVAYETGMTPWDEKNSGLDDILNDICEEKLGVTYLGSCGGKDWMYPIYSNVKIKNLDDTQGLTIRITSARAPMFEKLNIGYTLLPAGDIYSAMERGVIDGFSWSTLAVVDYGWAEVTKYIIKPFIREGKVSLFFNKDKWNGLPEDLRSDIMAVVEKTQREAYDIISDLVVEEQQKLIEAGLEIVEMDPVDAEIYKKASHDTLWESAIESNPEQGKMLYDTVHK